MKWIIRPEQPSDYPAINAVNQLAFNRDTEAKLVQAIRRSCQDCLSLVAKAEGDIIGHILFSPVRIDERKLNIMGLAPMAVHPDHQHHGVGSALVRDGLLRLRMSNIVGCVVLGHAQFYPRFGFRVARPTYNLTPPWDVPDEVFMAQELKHGAFMGGGMIRYLDVFDGVA